MWLNEIGIEIGYARLSHYAGQLKRRDQSAVAAVPANPVPVPPEHTSRENRTKTERHAPTSDPLANIREREDRRSGFQFNSEPDIKKLI